MTLDSYIQIRLPGALSNAVKQAASDRYLSSSGYIRQVLAEQLRREGVDPHNPLGHTPNEERGR